MAVTVEELALDLRLIASTAEAVPGGLTTILSRNLGAATAIVEERASAAPEALKDAAIVAIAAYMFDRPSAPSGGRYADAWTQSGAAAMLTRYVRRRARAISGDQTGFVPSGGGGPGVDELARAEAARAIGLAEDLQNDARIHVSFQYRPLNDRVIALYTDIAGAVGGQIRAIVEAVVPAWARAPNPPSGGGDDLPAIPEDGKDYTLQGRDRAGSGGSDDPVRFWARPNYVPDTPGTSSGVGHVLTVTGENDSDYAFRAPTGGSGVDQTARGGVADNARDIAALQGVTGGNRRTLAALEDVLPDPPIPAAAAAAADFMLSLPAKGAASERAMWKLLADATARADLATEVQARADADAALSDRIDAVETEYADPIFDPAYWLKGTDARSFIVHLDPELLGADVAKISLTLSGVKKTVARVADQHVYEFAFTATDAGNINRAAGNAGSKTLRSRIAFLDASDQEVNRQFGILLVLAEAPGGGGGGGMTLVYSEADRPDSRFTAMTNDARDLLLAGSAALVEWERTFTDSRFNGVNVASYSAVLGLDAFTNPPSGAFVRSLQRIVAPINPNLAGDMTVVLSVTIQSGSFGIETQIGDTPSGFAQTRGTMSPLKVWSIP